MKTIHQTKAGRMVGVILVGQLNGVRQIRWGMAILVSCALGVFGAAVAAAVYFALAGTFSPLAAIVGFGGPFVTIGSGIHRAAKLPSEQLPALDSFA